MLDVMDEYGTRKARFMGGEIDRLRAAKDEAGRHEFEELLRDVVGLFGQMCAREAAWQTQSPGLPLSANPWVDKFELLHSVAAKAVLMTDDLEALGLRADGTDELRAAFRECQAALTAYYDESGVAPFAGLAAAAEEERQAAASIALMAAPDMGRYRAAATPPPQSWHDEVPVWDDARGGVK